MSCLENIKGLDFRSEVGAIEQIEKVRLIP